MDVRLKLTKRLGQQFRGQLEDAPEDMVFLKGRRSRLRRGTFIVTHMLAMGNDDAEYHSHHGLTDAQRQRVFAWGAQSGDILVEAHSHGSGDPATFSHIDVQGLAEWVPHVRWRLAKRPYAALVFASKSYDGLAWLDDRGPVPITRVYFGAKLHRATSRSIRQWHTPNG